MLWAGPSSATFEVELKTQECSDFIYLLHCIICTKKKTVLSWPNLNAFHLIGFLFSFISIEWTQPSSWQIFMFFLLFTRSLSVTILAIIVTGCSAILLLLQPHWIFKMLRLIEREQMFLATFSTAEILGALMKSWRTNFFNTKLIEVKGTGELIFKLFLSFVLPRPH